MSLNHRGIFSSGSEQSCRQPVALQANYFNVDELSYESLLVLSKDIAAHLTFYNLDNVPKGYWDKMFLANDMVTMAMLKILDCDKLAIEFEEKLNHQLQQAVMFIVSLLGHINAWYQKLKLSNNDAVFELCVKIATTIDKKIIFQLDELLSSIVYVDGIDLEQIKQAFTDFDSVWGENIVNWNGSLNGRSSDTDEPSISHNSLDTKLQQFFSSLMNVLRFLQSDINTYIDALEQQSDHDPSIGLFMAFLKLYQRNQSHLNLFTMKHLTFFYEEILKFTQKPSLPESVYLTFLPTKELLVPKVIEKGCRFSCGKNEQRQDIIFEVNNDVLLSNVKVKSVFNLFLQRDPLISPESELHYVTKITKSCLVGATEQRLNDSFALFGANNIKGDQQSQQAPLGLAISGPVLNLKEGERNISLSIALAEPHQIDEHSLYLLNSALNDEQKKISLMSIINNLLEYETELMGDICSGISLQQKGNLSEVLIAAANQVMANIPAEQLQKIYGSDPHYVSQLIYKNYLLALLQLVTQETHFCLMVGRIFSRHTLACAELVDKDNQHNAWLHQDDINLIESKAKEFSVTEGMTRLIRLFRQNQFRTFYELYELMFDIQISTEEGWQTVNNYRIHPLLQKVNGDDFGLYGFTFNIILTADIAPTAACHKAIHGEQWETAEPVIQFSIKPLATFFPYSIFRSIVLSSIAIDVSVTGLTDLVVYNNLSRIDPSKTFVPLGALPTLHSYLILASEEMANKHITDININIVWSDLPTNEDGFKRYYYGYGEDFNNSNFRVELSVLKDGSWVKSGSDNSYPLFTTQPLNGELFNRTVISASVVNEFKPQRKANEKISFDYNLKSRNGFIKLELVSPNQAFGHQLYNTILTNTLLHNAKSKKQRILPNPPYTPSVSRLSIDYQAKVVIHTHPDNKKQNGLYHNVSHIHPFGYQQIYPATKKVGQSLLQYLFPRYSYDGNLFIGLEAVNLPNEISLFFHLDETSNINRGDQANDIKWFYLASEQWYPFSNQQVISDSTLGFITSGIITMTLPEGMTQDNTVMPAGQFWIRASADQYLDKYGKCLAIMANASQLNRVSIAYQEDLNIKKSTNWKSFHPIMGLSGTTQASDFFGGKPTESSGQFKQRVNERLRHKERAVSAWDHERLILEHFPEIESVTCFANLIYQQAGFFPGNILIIVRLKVSACDHVPCNKIHVSSNILTNIQNFISSKCSDFVTLDVQNPIYESLQVRCSVKFKRGENIGAALTRLNQDIGTYFCPWSSLHGNGGFGWSFKIKDIESIIRQLDYVQFVTEVSVLHIVTMQQDPLPSYQLIDSVIQDAEFTCYNSGSQKYIKASSPWCLLMPFTHHVINVIHDEIERTGTVTGVNELEVGGNFIVGSEDDQDVSSQKEV